MARVTGWTTGAEAGDLLYFDTTSNVTASTLQARTGNYSFRFAGNSNATRNLTSALDELYFRFAWYDGANGNMQDATIFQIRNSTTVLGTLRFIQSTRRLLLYSGNDATLLATSSLSLPLATWIRIEVYWKIADSGGRFDLRFDGVEVATFTGDTKPGTATTADNLRFSAPGNGTYYLDDLALNDTTGGSDNSWCGDGRIVALIPDGDGDASAWTPSAGTNYACVDDVPPDGDTTYVQASLSGTQDLYTVSAFDGTDKTILRAWAECRARGTVGGEQITLTVKTAGTEYQSAARSLTASYARYIGTDYATNPATSAAWTDGELDSVQVGQEVV